MTSAQSGTKPGSAAQPCVPIGRWGKLKRPPYETLGERAWWLYQLVRQTSLDWWTAHTGMTPDELVRWASRTDRAARAVLVRRRMLHGVIVHTERGSHYCSREHRALLGECGLIASISDRRSYLDNPVIESWNDSLKVEAIHGERFATRSQAKANVFGYIELDYNRNPFHSTWDYLSPNEFELFHVSQVGGAETQGRDHLAF